MGGYSEDTIVDARAPDDGGERAAPVLAGRYELIGLVGSGGMGTVYRARDRELDETVAIKVLKRRHADPETVERFRSEVRLARKVTHRNVVRIFDIGTDEGERFLSMEYLEGESLGETLNRHGRIPAPRVCAIARDLCAGLAASHDAGVLHGDLKPFNVVTDRTGRIVITDFGIARAASASTRPNEIAGTLAYMAPEQLTGDGDVDARADVYSLGCMLYCLLAGRPPWPAGSYEVAAARLLEDPPDVRAIASDVPPELAAIVSRCMARDRAERFGSARAIDAALPVIAAPAALATPITSWRSPAKSIAVLSFVNEGDRAHDYLVAGLTHALVESLRGVEEVRILGRGVAPSADAPSSIAAARELGQRLGADAVVDGTFTCDGARIGATIRLLTVEDGFHLAVRRYDASIDGVYRLAEDAARDLARALSAGDTRIAHLPTIDPKAVELYARGRYFYACGVVDRPEAVDLLRAAHERAPSDGRIAAAHALAARRQLIIGLKEHRRDDPRELAQQIVARHPDVADAHAALGLVHFDDAEYRSAAFELRRALALDPGSPDVLEFGGMFLSELGELDRAIDFLVRANEASPFAIAALARAHALRHDWAAAHALTRGDVDVAEISWLTRARLALWNGDPIHAAAELIAFRAATTVVLREPIEIFLTTACDRVLDLDVFRRLDATFAVARRIPRRATFHAQIGMELLASGGFFEEALTKADDLEETALIDLAWLDHCPALDPLRGDRAFVALRKSTAARAAKILAVIDG